MKSPVWLLGVCAALFVATFIPAWLVPEASLAAQREENLRYFGPPVTSGDEALALSRRVASMTIQHYDPEHAVVHQFEVTNRDGRWTIPSHHDYPADGGDQVGRTAGSMLGLQRRPEAQVSADPRDHSRLGVLDPLDEQAAFGVTRGKRLTLRGGDGEVILDLIVGNEVPERMGWYYLRQADESAVYQVEVEPVLSTRFTDYVDQNLLQVSRNEIAEVVLDPHRVDRQAGNVETRPKTILRRQGSTQNWTSPQAPEDQIVDTDAMRSLLDGINRVRLQGVRPLQPITMGRLAKFGFFTNDGATFWGYEGAVEVQHRNGIRYRLFFGERAPDEGLALTAGVEAVEGAENAEPERGSNRFMLILVSYDEEADQELAQALRDQEQSARAELAEGEKLNEEQQQALSESLAQLRTEHIAERHQLRDGEQEKFLEYFYVIPGSAYSALRPAVESLFKDQPEPGTNPGSDPAAIQESP